MKDVFRWVAEIVRSRAGILFIAPKGDQLKYALHLLFPASNNVAEYEALMHGLSIAVSLRIKRLMVYGDSLVVISQSTKIGTALRNP
jgi:ribonuclease HI